MELTSQMDDDFGFGRGGRSQTYAPDDFERLQFNLAQGDQNDSENEVHDVVDIGSDEGPRRTDVPRDSF